MYESPVELIFSEIKAELIKRENEVNEMIVRAVQGVVPTVTEEELVKALQYDRQQYKKGFWDGREARDAEIVRCEDCKWWDRDDEYCVDFLTQDKNGFCSWGERREDDEL